MIVNGGRAGGVDYNAKPRITYDGKWTGWYLEVYDGTPYWEALFSTSGHLVALADYTCDAWGIGGGGAGASVYNGGYLYGTGGGSGFTNMSTGLSIAAGGHHITIGEGGKNFTDGGYSNRADSGTATTFLELTCNGGQGGLNEAEEYVNDHNYPQAEGGSAGGTTIKDAGENGTPGAGKIMSKFWSVEHNTDYGARGEKSRSNGGNGGGGGGFKSMFDGALHAGQGYGGGGSGTAQYGGTKPSYIRFAGCDGCLIIRIKAE